MMAEECDFEIEVALRHPSNHSVKVSPKGWHPKGLTEKYFVKGLCLVWAQKLNYKKVVKEAKN